MMQYFDILAEHKLEVSLFAGVVFHLLLIFGISVKQDRPILSPQARSIEILIEPVAPPAIQPAPVEPDPVEPSSPEDPSVEENPQTPAIPDLVEIPPEPIDEPEQTAEPDSFLLAEPAKDTQTAVIEPESPPELETVIQEDAIPAIPVTPSQPDLPKTPRRLISAADLLRSSEKETSLLATHFGEEMIRTDIMGPRKKFISGQTTDYKYAAYLDSWRRKIERIGNLNYPEQAKRKKIFGKLIITVGIFLDGTIERIQIDRSSGHDLLDQAAKNIVRLSAPFPQIPANIASEVDILYITRTWHFRDTYELTSK